MLNKFKNIILNKKLFSISFFGVYIRNFIIFAMQNKRENLRVFMEYPAMHEHKFNLLYSGKLGDLFVEICAKILKTVFLKFFWDEQFRMETFNFIMKCWIVLENCAGCWPFAGFFRLNWRLFYHVN